MGYRFRKSINCGMGFRVNISKTGIGYSWGVPGYRVTRKANGGIRKTYSIPGTGISYVEESSSKSQTNAVLPRANSMERYNIENNIFHDVKNGKIKDLSSSETSAFVATISKIKTRNALTWSVFVLAACLYTFFLRIQPESLGIGLFYLMFISSFIVTISLNKRRFVYIEYSVDEESKKYLCERNNAFKALSYTKKVWSINNYEDVAYSRVNAGCKTNINRKLVTLKLMKLPMCLRTNDKTMFYRLSIGFNKYIFLPDKIVVLGLCRAAAISYCDISISIINTPFVETGVAPTDAILLYNTWQYVNNNGTPDRRFKNNRQMPVYQYSKVIITSPNGLNLHLIASNYQKAEEFKKLYDCLD